MSASCPSICWESLCHYLPYIYRAFIMRSGAKMWVLWVEIDQLACRYTTLLDHIYFNTVSAALLHGYGRQHFRDGNANAGASIQCVVAREDADIRVLGSVWSAADASLGLSDGRISECYGGGELVDADFVGIVSSHFSVCACSCWYRALQRCTWLAALRLSSTWREFPNAG